MYIVEYSYRDIENNRRFATYDSYPTWGKAFKAAMFECPYKCQILEIIEESAIVQNDRVLRVVYNGF